MRLLNVETFKLEEYFGDDIPSYAILSHTWGNDDEEITFRDIEAGRVEKGGNGLAKVRGCCNQAWKDGLRYAWIDTCCIDKTSSSELTDCINSMFRWYERASVCYAYLSDVPAGDNPRQPDSKFFSSRWFTRGWTLQELLAPKKLCFYDLTWGLLGTKSNLSGVIPTITRVPRPFLLGLATLREASVAQRMSWAANRRTKREEDLAYCLLGIFGVMMPMIYGEGNGAFIRLQKEIMKDGGDDSILAWGLNIEGPSGSSDGILAASPSDFANCGHIVSGNPFTSHTSSLEISSGRLRTHLPVHTTSEGNMYALTRCRPERNSDQVVGVPLEMVHGPSHNYIRPTGQLPILLPRAASGLPTPLISIGKDPKRNESSESRRHWFYIEEPDGIDLELIEVEPRDRWRKDQAMIATGKPTDDNSVQYTLARFRSRRDDWHDIMIILEYSADPVRAKFYTMLLFNDTPLARVLPNLDYLLPKAHSGGSVSTGTIHLGVSVRAESIAGQPMFVVSLGSTVYSIGVTINASRELHIMGSKSEFVNMLQNEDLRASEARDLYKQAGEQSIRVEEKKKQLDDIREKIRKLREEENLLVGELEKATEEAHELESLSNACERHANDLIEERMVEQQRLAEDPNFSAADIAKMLMTKEANPEPAPQSNEAALLEAAAQDCWDAVAFLLDCYVDADTADTEGNTPLHRASSQGHINIVRLLVDRGADMSLENKNGSTPMHSASARGNSEVVALLLERGANIGAKDKKGYTPLHTASSWGRVDVARLLLNRGADLGAKHRKGSTPLHCAVARGHTEMCQLLLDSGADVNAWGGYGWRPLHTASSWGHIELSRLLLDHGAHANNITRDGSTPLHFAARNGHTEAASLLLDRGANIIAKDENDYTPLHTASGWGNIEVARLLLNRGAPVDYKSRDGSTPLHFATENGPTKVAQLLADHGADISATNGNGDTPLGLAIKTANVSLTTQWTTKPFNLVSQSQ